MIENLLYQKVTIVANTQQTHISSFKHEMQETGREINGTGFDIKFTEPQLLKKPSVSQLSSILHIKHP